MDLLRKHWYDLGGILSLFTLAFVFFFRETLSPYEMLMWLSLVSLFFHQLEEYRIVGTFPGMINSVMFKSSMPDRYPLNSNSALIINVGMGWLFYLLAALLGERAIWLGIATMMVSAGNIVAHTFLFNIKGRTFRNAGMLTSWFCFLPCVIFFIQLIRSTVVPTSIDLWIGIPLGIALNAAVFLLIHLLKDRTSAYVFEQRNLLAQDRN